MLQTMKISKEENVFMLQTINIINGKDGIHECDNIFYNHEHSSLTLLHFTLFRDFPGRNFRYFYLHDLLPTIT